MQRLIYLVLGYGFVALGFVGVVLPVLPTTPFLILAVGCFARSSPRLEAWLLGHPRFGPLLTDWRAHGAIPKRAKFAAYGGMALGFAVFLYTSRPGWALALAVAALMGIGAAYVASRPLPPTAKTEPPETPTRSG